MNGRKIKVKALNDIYLLSSNASSGKYTTKDRQITFSELQLTIQVLHPLDFFFHLKRKILRLQHFGIPPTGQNPAHFSFSRVKKDNDLTFTEDVLYYDIDLEDEFFEESRCSEEKILGITKISDNLRRLKNQVSGFTAYNGSSFFGQTIFLETAVGFGGNSHFNTTSRGSYLLIVFPEMVFILQLQQFAVR